MARILLVESDKRSQERATGFLEDAGHRVVSFEDGHVALEAAPASVEQETLMIVAWDLAGPVRGPELLARLAQNKAAIPRLVTSPMVSLDVITRITEWGARDVLLKPVYRERLLEAVRQCVRGADVDEALLTELKKELIGDAPGFLEAVEKIGRAIKHPELAVLLIGENGCGKEVFAQLLHRETEARQPPPTVVSADSAAAAPAAKEAARGRPAGEAATTRGRLEAVNLAGLSETLIESELFGHEEGAFTDAKRQHIGAFERAGDGTLFLDEIGCLALELQPKLLRAIEAREFTRVGGQESISFDARLVCATNRNLVDDMKQGLFREDLYYRISEFEIRIPPLRERKQDISALAKHFLKDSGLELERETLTVLQAYPFPGNVRELKNILSQARAVSPGKTIRPVDLPSKIMEERQTPPRVPESGWPEELLGMTYDEAMRALEARFNRVYLPRKLEEAGQNRNRAAELIGVTPKTLRQKLKDCGLGHLIRERDDQP